MSPAENSSSPLRLRQLERALRTPGRARSVVVRRGAALVLLSLAAANAAGSVRAHPEVLVVTADLPAGHVLTPADVELRRVPASLIPAAALDSVADADGDVLVAAAAAGEILTSARLLDATLAAGSLSDSVGDAATNLVPLTLAEPDVATLLHHGDTVSVIAGSTAHSDVDHSGGHAVIAEGARVLSAQPESARPGTIVVVLPADAAARVAAESLARPLTVVVTGPRAQ